MILNWEAYEHNRFPQEGSKRLGDFNIMEELFASLDNSMLPPPALPALVFINDDS